MTRTSSRERQHGSSTRPNVVATSRVRVAPAVTPKAGHSLTYDLSHFLFRTIPSRGVLGHCVSTRYLFSSTPQKVTYSSSTCSIFSKCVSLTHDRSRTTSVFLCVTSSSSVRRLLPPRGIAPSSPAHRPPTAEAAPPPPHRPATPPVPHRP
jgi:hypothetical protein